MAWFFLFLAGLCETAWVVSIRYSEGFTKIIPGVTGLLFMLVSVYLLSLSLKSVPIGIAYGVWTGTGIIGTAVFGMIFLNETHDVLKLLCLFLIIAGIVGLRILEA